MKAISLPCFLCFFVILNFAGFAGDLTNEPKPAFRIVFKVRDGEVLQVNTVDKRQPSQFLKVGDLIVGTNLKIVNLKVIMPKYSDKDSSEITVQNPETKKSLVLVLGNIVDVSSIER